MSANDPTRTSGRPNEFAVNKSLVSDHKVNGREPPTLGCNPLKDGDVHGIEISGKALYVAASGNITTI